MYRHQCCQEYLERLSAAEYEAVIKNFTISPKALEVRHIIAYTNSIDCVQLIPASARTKIVLECIKFSRDHKMDEVEVKLQQLLQHLAIVSNKTLSPLASKVCLYCVRCVICRMY